MSKYRRYWADREVVYRFYSADGQLLYVGQSANLPARMDMHRSQTAWFALVTRTSVQVFRDHQSALRAEREAIRDERPLMNVRGTPAGRRLVERAPQEPRRITEDGRLLLRELMKVRRMTVRELAELCGNPKHRAGIAHLLSGSRVSCNARLAEAIQRVLLGSAADDRIFLPTTRRLRAVA